jgi:hypothetical protein
VRQRFELIYVLSQLRKQLVQVVVHVFVIRDIDNVLYCFPELMIAGDHQISVVFCHRSFFVILAITLPIPNPLATPTLRAA